MGKDRHAAVRDWLLRGLRKRRRGPLPEGAALSHRAQVIWRERPDLRAAFDISTPDGTAGMFWWYLRHGFRELQLAFDPAEQALASSVNQSHPGVRQAGFLPVTWLMHGLNDHAPAPLRLALNHDARQDEYLAWFFAKGLTSANLDGFLSIEQARALVAPDHSYPSISCLHVCLWRSDDELRARFASPEDQEYMAWCRTEGVRLFPILFHPLIALASPPPRRGGRGLPFGVNLVGHARGRSGVSEDVRAAARVLDAAGIDYVLCDVDPGEGMPQEETVKAQKCGRDLPYAITMVCMTAEATLLAAHRLGHAAFADHHVIGFWPWELPELPEIWYHAYDLVDEVWASSAFTYAAFCRSSPVAVRQMPMAVTVGGSMVQDRAAFALPPEAFLFGFAFDGLSSFARKAPYHCIDAFRRAFPNGNEPVGLVIKAMRVEGDPQWDALVRIAHADPRIHLVAQSLSRSALLDLWRTLDCFVSLHRSEGFGRNIAEVMRMGIPVITTAHSGNMDFTTHATAALVPVRLTQVVSGEYPFGERQVWADPDLDCAAAHMRRMVADASWREGLAIRGRERVAWLYDVEQVARSWTPILKDIYDAIDPSRP